VSGFKGRFYVDDSLFLHSVILTKVLVRIFRSQDRMEGLLLLNEDSVYQTFLEGRRLSSLFRPHR